MQNQVETKNSFKLLLLASAITLLLWFIPFAEVITYPFRLFVTFIHETGHAVATLATAGSVHSLAIHLDGSGLMQRSGGWGLLISSAGYLSTTIFGSLLLLLLRRPRFAKPAAIGTAVLLLIVPLLFTGNLWAWLFGLTLGAGFLAFAVKGNQNLLHFFMSFLAVQSILNAFYDLRALLYLSVFNPDTLTDARNMQEASAGLIPATVWAIGWSLVSLLILGGTLVVYYRSLQKRETEAPMPNFPLLTEHSRSLSDRQL